MERHAIGADRGFRDAAGSLTAQRQESWSTSRRRSSTAICCCCRRRSCRQPVPSRQPRPRERPERPSLRSPQAETNGNQEEEPTHDELPRAGSCPAARRRDRRPARSRGWLRASRAPGDPDGSWSAADGRARRPRGRRSRRRRCRVPAGARRPESPASAASAIRSDRGDDRRRPLFERKQRTRLAVAGRGREVAPANRARRRSSSAKRRGLAAERLQPLRAGDGVRGAGEMRDASVAERVQVRRARGEPRLRDRSRRTRPRPVPHLTSTPTSGTCRDASSCDQRIVAVHADEDGRVEAMLGRRRSLGWSKSGS